MIPQQPLDYTIDHDQLEELKAPEYYPEYLKYPETTNKQTQARDYAEEETVN
jgi:hypothetical protein